jgi:hypothetical protein
MGGLISMYAICEYPEVLWRRSLPSTHWVGITDLSDDEIPIAFENYLKQKTPNPKTIKSISILERKDWTVAMRNIRTKSI